MEKELEQMLQTVCSKGIKEASSEEIYAALLQWSKEKMNGMKHNEGDRKLYYISAEFLVGKLLSNNLINLGVFEEVREVLKKHGHDLTEIEEVELEPSLGNGGLGRLAACFLDSISNDALIYTVQIKQVQFVAAALISRYVNVIHGRFQGKIFKRNLKTHICFCQPALFCDPWIFLFPLFVIRKFLKE